MQKSDELLDPYRKITHNNQVSIEDRILEGPAAIAICEAAELEKADLIVRGHRGRTIWKDCCLVVTLTG